MDKAQYHTTLWHNLNIFRSRLECFLFVILLKQSSSGETKGQCYKTSFVLNLRIVITSQGVCQTRFEKFARDKHYSSLQKSLNHCRKKFYNIGPKTLIGVVHILSGRLESFLYLIHPLQSNTCDQTKVPIGRVSFESIKYELFWSML